MVPCLVLFSSIDLTRLSCELGASVLNVVHKGYPELLQKCRKKCPSSSIRHFLCRKQRKVESLELGFGKSGAAIGNIHRIGDVMHY